MTAPSPFFHSPRPRRKRRPHEEAIVELVEVPFVEEEQVERPEALRAVAPACSGRRYRQTQARTMPDSADDQRQLADPDAALLARARGGS